MIKAIDLKVALLGGIVLGALLGLEMGCHSLSPAQEARFDQRKCEVAAVDKVVGPALDAAVLVEQLYAGSASMSTVLQNVGATRAEVETLLADLKACAPQPAPAPEPLPAGDPS